ncbi:unnamed protein product [Symbiodinium sp. KB8]|nr:unnamed protein product [Symbiodinium sp. KB8]
MRWALLHAPTSWTSLAELQTSFAGGVGRSRPHLAAFFGQAPGMHDPYAQNHYGGYDQGYGQGGYGQGGYDQGGYGQGHGYDQDISMKEEEVAEEDDMEENSEHLSHMTCGISSGAEGGSQVTCGVPMYRDKATGAPYIMPLYTEPVGPKAGLSSSEKAGAGGGAPVVFSSPAAEAEAARAQMMEAAASTRIRTEAMNLLRGFLDNAPAPPATSSPSGFLFKGPGMPSKLFYPIPSKTSPSGIEVVPDIGPVGEPTPEVPGGMNAPGVGPSSFDSNSIMSQMTGGTPM